MYIYIKTCVTFYLLGLYWKWTGCAPTYGLQLFFFFFLFVVVYRRVSLPLWGSKIIFFCFLVLRGGDTPKGQFVRKWMVKKEEKKKKKLTKICGYFSVCVAFLWSTIYLNKSNSKIVCVFLFYSLNWNGYQVQQVIRFVDFMNMLNQFVLLVTMDCKGQHQRHSRIIWLIDWFFFFLFFSIAFLWWVPTKNFNCAVSRKLFEARRMKFYLKKKQKPAKNTEINR